MNTYDPEMASRVWQRVQSGKNEMPELPREDNLAALILAEGESAAALQQLARQMPKAATELQRLAREAQAHGACLRGMYTLMNDRIPAVRVPPVVREAPLIALRKCYGRLIRLLGEYERRSGDPEYGPVFRDLAEQTRKHCRSLLEVIGSMGDQKGR